jgi:uncharacterized membrane protein
LFIEGNAMNSQTVEPQGDGVRPADAAHQAALRAQIEQRLQAIFHSAGDGEAARQLLRMVIDYRLRQTS